MQCIFLVSLLLAHGRYLFKVNNKDTKLIYMDVILVYLLLALNISKIYKVTWFTNFYVVISYKKYRVKFSNGKSISPLLFHSQFESLSQFLLPKFWNPCFIISRSYIYHYIITVQVYFYLIKNLRLSFRKHWWVYLTI